MEPELEEESALPAIITEPNLIEFRVTISVLALFGFIANARNLMKSKNLL